MIDNINYRVRSVTDNLGTYSYEEWLAKGPEHRTACHEKARTDMRELEYRCALNFYQRVLTTEPPRRRSLWSLIKEWYSQ